MSYSSFSLAGPLLGKEKIILLPAGVCKVSGMSVMCVRAPPSGLLYSILSKAFLYSFSHFPLTIKLFPQKHHLSKIRFSVFSSFIPRCQEGPFLAGMSHVGGKVYRLEAIEATLE